jgi:3,4-dihydroxy 2-butanone 4-phosphate synthase / GTP cyclohydrolase II
VKFDFMAASNFPLLDKTYLDSFEEVLADFKSGKIVILVDDANREDEGDLVVLSELIEEHHLSFLINLGRGLICTSISVERALELRLPLQTAVNLSSFNTPFTVSVDLKSEREFGIEVTARTKTIRALTDATVTSKDFISPGHVFPLAAHPRGVLGRRGQTEGSYDMARIVGQNASAVICEILNTDGTMMRGSDLRNFANMHGLKVTSVEEVFQYRITNESFFQKTIERNKCIKGVPFTVGVYEDELDGKEHMALQYQRPDLSDTNEVVPLVRIHSECLTGDVFGSRRCDCGEQLDTSLKLIIERGRGVLIYLRQEGRGVGLGNKIKAYSLQDSGLDTVEANVQLGLQVDMRDYRLAGKILKQIGFPNIEILTNNPDKLAALQKCGIENVVKVPLKVIPDEFNEGYLLTKKNRLGHDL